MSNDNTVTILHIRKGKDDDGRYFTVTDVRIDAPRELQELEGEAF